MEKHLCGRCSSELKNTFIGMGDPFGMMGPTVRYCENSLCDLCGVLTMAERVQKDDVTISPTKGETPNSKTNP